MSDTQRKRKGDEISRTFCVLPWMHRFTNIGGEIQVCCTSEEADNNIRDDQGRKMNATRVLDDEKIMNSAFMRHLRLQMLRGTWPALCQRCKLTEEVGGISRRETENEKYASELKDLARRTFPDGWIPMQIRSADVRLGNLCNLACRMCNPRSSSGWIRDWKKVDQRIFSVTPKMEKEFKGYNWYSGSRFARSLEKQLPTLEYLHFAGGEPLVVPEMAQFLRTCVESGHSSHIDLTYNTNLTRIPEEVKKLWPSFKSVRLYCSLDGFGGVNELIRHPSRWDTIDRNLRDIDRNHLQYGVTQVLVSCTVQVYNVFSLGELYDYLAESFEFIDPIPNLVDLHYPRYYRTQILPPGLKKRAEEHLRSILTRCEQRIQSGKIDKQHAYKLDSLRGAINFLNAENLEPVIPEFLRAAESKDTFRKQDLYQVIPALRELQDYREL